VVRIRHRRAASAAEGSSIGGRLAQNRRFVSRDQFFSLEQAEIFDADVEAGEKRGAGDFAASPAMAQLEGAGRFGEFEADASA